MRRARSVHGAVCPALAIAVAVAFDDQARYLDEILTARRVDHVLEIVPGAHDFAFWKARLPKSLAFFEAKLAHQ